MGEIKSIWFRLQLTLNSSFSDEVHQGESSFPQSALLCQLTCPPVLKGVLLIWIASRWKYDSRRRRQINFNYGLIPGTTNAAKDNELTEAVAAMIVWTLYTDDITKCVIWPKNMWSNKNLRFAKQEHYQIHDYVTVMAWRPQTISLIAWRAAWLVVHPTQTGPYVRFENLFKTWSRERIHCLPWDLWRESLHLKIN